MIHQMTPHRPAIRPPEDGPGEVTREDGADESAAGRVWAWRDADDGGG